MLFAGYAMWKFQQEYHAAKALFERGGAKSELLREDMLSVRDKFALLPRVLPFVILLTGVMIALYGGYATPSPTELRPILVSTLQESTMLMLIIGMSLLYSYVMSYLHISQSTAQWIVDMHLSSWVLLAAILLMVIVLGVGNI